MGINTLGNGNLVVWMEKECSGLKMEMFMMETFKMESIMEKPFISILMEIYMKETILIMSEQVMVNIATIMVTHLKVNFKTMCIKAMEFINEKMGRSMKESMLKEKDLDKENLLKKMAIFI